MIQTKDEIKNNLGRLVYLSFRSLTNRLNKNLSDAGYDITAEQMRMLLILWLKDGLSHQEIATILNREKTGITRLINGLEKRNLVVRIPDKSDRRQKLVYLTPKGKKLESTLLTIARKTRVEASFGINEKEMDICKQVLRKIRYNLSE
ncbi:MAG: MarR family transcriptional regulator [Desulfobacterales bacterium]|nr:MarR family transcriptional regulator [Desulfobacterales bacterium]